MKSSGGANHLKTFNACTHLISNRAPFLEDEYQLSVANLFHRCGRPRCFCSGPYQINSGQTSYYYLSGTSMASLHIAGIVALMAQRKSTLTAGEAESILQSTVLPMSAGPNSCG